MQTWVTTVISGMATLILGMILKQISDLNSKFDTHLKEDAEFRIKLEGEQVKQTEGIRTIWAMIEAIK